MDFEDAGKHSIHSKKDSTFTIVDSKIAFYISEIARSLLSRDEDEAALQITRRNSNAELSTAALTDSELRVRLPSS